MWRLTIYFFLWIIQKFPESGINVPAATGFFENAHQRILIATAWLLNFWPKVRNESNQNNRTTVVSLPNLPYFVTTIKTWHQFCSLFSSSTAILFSTRKSNKLQMCASLWTKNAMLTFYFLKFIVAPCLLTFNCF